MARKSSAPLPAKDPVDGLRLLVEEMSAQRRSLERVTATMAELPGAIVQFLSVGDAEPSAPLRNPDVVQLDEALMLRWADGSQVPLRWRHDGSVIRSLLPGWRASWIYNDFRPLRLIELAGPGASTATWFVDDNGTMLGDQPFSLSSQHRTMLSAALKNLLFGPGAAALALRMRYQRLNPATRLHLEALLPNAAHERALDLSQAAAASSAPTREFVRIEGLAAGRPAAELVEGWRTAEVDGGSCCMAVGISSVVRLTDVPRSKAYLLEIINGPVRMSRRMHVHVNGRLIAISPLHPIYNHSYARLGYWIPPELIGAGTIEITLDHAPATGPSDEAFVLDHIRLSVGEPVSRQLEAAEPDDRELMLRFQSMGDNCQFGFVQRHFGAEPMGLLRFGGSDNLVGLIDAKLQGLGDPGTLTCPVVAAEYQIRDARYLFSYHTFKHPDEISPEQVIAENEVKLRYLKRKFIEDLEDGETIWVYRRVFTDDVAELFALRKALHHYGPHKLLWVTPAPPDRRAGDVEWLSADFLRGYLAADAANDPFTFNPDHWLLLCRNAHRAFAER